MPKRVLYYPQRMKEQNLALSGRLKKRRNKKKGVSCAIPQGSGIVELLCIGRSSAALKSKTFHAAPTVPATPARSGQWPNNSSALSPQHCCTEGALCCKESQTCIGEPSYTTKFWTRRLKR
jgi:hypothetical protein